MTPRSLFSAGASAAASQPLPAEGTGREGSPPERQQADTSAGGASPCRAATASGIGADMATVAVAGGPHGGRFQQQPRPMARELSLAFGVGGAAGEPAAPASVQIVLAFL